MPSWYWPDYVPRHMGTPPFFLHHLAVRRWAKRRPDSVAAVEGRDEISYADLDLQVRDIASGLAEPLEGSRWRLVLLAEPGASAVAALLGAAAARCFTFLADPGLPPDRLSAFLARAGADAVLADEQGEAALRRVQQAPPVVRITDLIGRSADGTPPTGTASVRGPAFAIPGGEDGGTDLLVYHSHYSLLSGAVAMASFFQIRQDDVFAATFPHWTWEGLYSILTPLFLGGTVVLGDLDNPDSLGSDIQQHEVAYVFFPFEEAADLGRRGPKRLTDAIRRTTRAVLLSTPAAFRTDDRRRLQKTWNVPLLTVWGLPETGAAIASHASWYLDEAAGIPITCAEVQPAEPETGRRLETAWELLEYAAIVVKSPLGMVGYDDEAETARRLRDGWFNSGILSTADANGMVYLLR